MPECISTQLNDFVKAVQPKEEKLYNIYRRWNENTSNYKKFDGGIESMNIFPLRYERAVFQTATHLAGMEKFTKDENGNVVNEFGEIEFHADGRCPSCDFGDGTIYIEENIIPVEEEV